MYNFVQLCIQGDALLEDIDDYIDKWHDSDSNEKLYEFLGMLENEYAIWLKNPNILPIIIKAHRENKSSLELMNAEVYALAARSKDVQKSEQLKKWLIAEGLWKEE